MSSDGGAPERTLKVPPMLVARLDELLAQYVERTGDPLELARKLIEPTIIKRGLESLEAEERKRA